MPLRDDLEISTAAPFLSGAPGWVIHDPVRHRFFQIGQFTMEVLSRWSVGTASVLKRRLLDERAIEVEEADLDAIEQFLMQNQLLERGERGTAARYAEAGDQNLMHTVWRGLQKMLFVRVPLVRPERFLRATWPFVRPLFSKTFVVVTVCLLLLGLFLAGRQYAEIETHFRQAFNWAGAGLFVVAIAFVKMLHELGHAYQAVSRGIRVPVMGVAFFAFLPLLYTDVSDAWRLKSRRDRLMVDLGGIYVELALAVYATLFWCFLPDGPARTVAFAVATSSWVLSLLVNLNPFMRFDGYFLLSDGMGVHNLQQRSFALAKWAMRRRLFDLEDQVPERLDAGLRKTLIWYAFGVWTYRFFLFLTIALLVYAMFFKLAGLVLLAVSVGAFIIKPIVAEIAFWVRARHRRRTARRSLVSATVFVIVLALFFWPWPTRFQSPALLEDARQYLVFPPDPARLDAVYVQEGQTVSKGDRLFLFADPDLPVRVAQSQTRIDMFERRLLSAAGDAVERAESQVIERILQEERESLRAARERAQRLEVVAPSDGLVRDLLPGLTEGAWYPRDQLLARVVQPGALSVRGYIHEADRDSFDPGSDARFIPDDPSIPVLTLNGLSFSDYAIDRLQEGYLAQPNGGLIATATADPTNTIVAGVWYPLTAFPEASGVSAWRGDDRAKRGVVSLRRKPQSMAYRIWKRIARVLIREFEF